MQYYYHYKAINTHCKNGRQLVAYELVTEKEAEKMGITEDCKQYCKTIQHNPRDTWINFGCRFKKG